MQSLMTKEKMIALLEQLPAGTTIYTRSFEYAYPAKLRAFSTISAPTLVTAFMCSDFELASHGINFPEKYSGVKEIELEGV